MFFNFLTTNKFNFLHIYFIYINYNMDKEKIAQEIIDIYNNYGNKDYIGEKITQIEHAIQSAIYAQAFIDIKNKHLLKDYNIELTDINEKDKNSIIIGCLLHDIGHLLHYINNEHVMMMSNLGVKYHEKIGAEYLKILGFNEIVIDCVNSHVDAKRYLITTDEKYREKLSEASLKTLEYQGGLMKNHEMEAFKRHKYFKYAILARLADDYAKVQNTKLLNIDFYKNSIIDCIE